MYELHADCVGTVGTNSVISLKLSAAFVWESLPLNVVV